MNQISFIYTVRAIFILLSTILATLLCHFNPGLKGSPHLWAAGGFCIASFVAFVESCVREVYPKTLVVGVVGLLLGLITASLVSGAIPAAELMGPVERATSVAALHLFFGYLGTVVALRNVERIEISSSHLITAQEPRLKDSKILDTSVLIDGRILEMVSTGFIGGIFVIPKFVIDELQNVADSQDGLRRQRGRRGLDVLRELKDSGIELVIMEKDYPHIQSVDAKLIQCAKDFQARIVTNDFNLNKVADIHNIRVLNINDLANTLKPVILPGETFSIQPIKSGKEPGQGVGYLQDGTMVVVEDGGDRLQEEVVVTVTSILQTAAGRMIFSRIETEEDGDGRRKVAGGRPNGGRKVVDLETGRGT